MLWTERLSPKKLDDIVGNSDAVETVKKWAYEWERGKAMKPLLLIGPAGVGKSAIARALASEMGWEIVEMNASDIRDKETVMRILGSASTMQGLFGSRRLILIDEVDGLYRSDRGGANAIAEVIKGASQPIILTANDPYAKSLSAIRGLCTEVKMKRINVRSVASFIKKIAQQEGVEITQEIVNTIAESSKGDLRSAINDMQALAEGRTKIGSFVLGVRDREEGVYNVVQRVLKSTSYVDALDAIENVDVDHDMLKAWIDENIADEYENPSEIANAYDALSRADVFDGRIYRRQYWGFLRYSNVLMSAGVALSKKERYRKYVVYRFPTRIRTLSTLKAKRESEKKVGMKIGAKLHCSSKEARWYFPIIARMLEDDREGTVHFFKFDEEDEEMLKSAHLEVKKKNSE
ncbi:MAG: replication factor C large subunit [Candidatus Micrarchaeia archaeon]